MQTDQDSEVLPYYTKAEVDKKLANQSKSLHFAIVLLVVIDILILFIFHLLKTAFGC